MFALRNVEVDPTVIVQTEGFSGKIGFNSKAIRGVWHRIFPVNGREISALRMLDHRVEKFAPFFGNGILISDAALRKFTT